MTTMYYNANVAILIVSMNGVDEQEEKVIFTKNEQNTARTLELSH